MDRNPYPDQLDFWAMTTNPSSNAAHAYKDGRALCGSDLVATNGANRWPTPGNIGCKQCRRVLLARVGRICRDCLGKGRHCVRRYPSRRYRLCSHCHGIGYLYPLDLPTDGPPLPPAPNLRPPL